MVVTSFQWLVTIVCVFYFRLITVYQNNALWLQFMYFISETHYSIPEQWIVTTVYVFDFRDSLQCTRTMDCDYSLCIWFQRLITVYQNNGLWLQFMYFISETHYSVSEQWIVTTVYVFYFRDSLQCIRTMDCDYSLCILFQRLITMYQNNGLWLQFMYFISETHYSVSEQWIVTTVYVFYFRLITMYQNNGLWLQFMYIISETHYNVSEQWIVTTVYVFYFRDSLQCIRTMDCDYSLCILFQRLITMYQNNGLWLQFMYFISETHYSVSEQWIVTTVYVFYFRDSLQCIRTMDCDYSLCILFQRLITVYQNNGLWLQFMYFISETHYSVSEQWIVTTVYVFYFRDSLQCIRTMDCDYSLCILFQRLITMYQNNGLWLKFMYFISETHYNVSEQWIVTTVYVFYFRDSLQCIRTMDCDYSLCILFQETQYSVSEQWIVTTVYVFLFQRLITMYQNNGLWLQFMYFISETHYSVSEQWIVTTVYVFYFRDSLQCIRTMDCDYSLCILFQRLITMYQNNGLWLQFMYFISETQYSVSEQWIVTTVYVFYFRDSLQCIRTMDCDYSLCILFQRLITMYQNNGLWLQFVYFISETHYNVSEQWIVTKVYVFYFRDSLNVSEQWIVTTVYVFYFRDSLQCIRTMDCDYSLCILFQRLITMYQNNGLWLQFMYLIS